MAIFKTEENLVNEKLNVQVCVGMNCSFRGGLQLLEALETDQRFQKICEINSSTCLGEACNKGNDSPVVQINDHILVKTTLEEVVQAILQHATNHD
jgi:NADH:ubiquinone oxidoreductase subunit E